MRSSRSTSRTHRTIEGGEIDYYLVTEIDDGSYRTQKFRGLSKPGLEQSVRTYRFVRTLNLAGAPLHGLLDCFVVNVFR
jgi:hypothetical protein